MEFKFEVERNGNTSRSFHTNVTVGKKAIEHYAPWLSGSYNDALRDQEQIVANMVRDLLRIDGINDVFVEPYEVSVHMDQFRRSCIHWNEKIDRIVKNAVEKLYHEQMGPAIRKVLVEKRSGDRSEAFHTHFEISRSVIEDFRRPLRDSSQSYLTKIGPNGERLVRSLMDLPGVIQIWMQPYEVSVEIAKAFDWYEHDNNGKSLEDKVKEAIRQVFGLDIFFVDK
ncbi:MAG: hypothetical protein NT162_02920 [Candidatus Woesebacteria bacterium]|nr:hypothetical protein [Candidatus Woesebacteria bacterium]